MTDTAPTTAVRVTARTNPASIATGTYGTGRAVKATSVKLGPFEATARRTADAVDAVTHDLVTFLAVDSYEPLVLSYRGHVAVSALIPSCDGGVAWFRQTVSPDPTSSGRSTSSYEGRDVEHARSRMALAQLAVTDWTDDLQVFDAALYVAGPGRVNTGAERDLLDYAAFQRAFVAAPVDADRWQWAQDHRAEYVPVLPEAA